MTALPTAINEDQRDALQEVFNIAIGKAGASLARFLDAHVSLSIPKLYLSDIDAFLGHIERKPGFRGEISAVHQSFAGRIRGETFTLFQGDCCEQEIARMLCYSGDSSEQSVQEAMLDMSNIIVSACLNSLAQQFVYQLSFSSPTLVAERQGIPEIFACETTPWRYSMIMETGFALDKSRLGCILLIFLSENSAQTLIQSTDMMLTSL